MTTQMFILNDGNKIPVIGLGTWRSKPDEVSTAVRYAIDIGYRHIDCAYIYGNEKEVGQAIISKIREGVVKRDELFITTKLWHSFHRPTLVESALRQQLDNLGLDYVDLYLMHSPFAYKEGIEDIPFNKVGNVEYSDVDYIDTWAAMEELIPKGLTKSIGVANFNIKQISRLCMNCASLPVVNQIECNPYFRQKKLIQFCNFKGILISAFCPLGFPPYIQHTGESFLDDFRLKSLARRYRKSAAQVALRYQIQRNIIVVPDSANPVKIRENIDIFDFQIQPEYMEKIDMLDRNKRTCWFPTAMHHKYYPFKNERCKYGKYKMVEDWDYA